MEEKRLFVLPGEMAISRQPAIIATLLGSCVAICLYNTKLKAGGMNHYMLPTGLKTEEMKGKYGDFAIDKLVEMMLKLDTDKNNLIARVYGGGAVVGHLSAGVGIGEKNIEIARSMLDAHGIKIATMDTGGMNGRKIFFNTFTGNVELRLIEKSEMTKQLEEKKKDMIGRKIRVMVVDDSPTIRQIITKAISADPEIHVVGEAGDPYEARSMMLEINPDVLTLDIIMPKMDGVTFLKKLMIHMPLPVIVVSSVAQKGSNQRLRAQEIGAFDVIDKEDLKMYQGLSTATQILTSKIKMAALTHVKKRTEAEIGHI